MIGLLQRLVATVEAIGTLAWWAIANALNAVIAAVGALLSTVLGLLAFMPDPPEQPAAAWIGWLNWIYPLGAAVGIVSGLLVLYVGFLVLRIALNWVKAL